jgi:DNA polymerase-3 subunit alpha
MTSPPDNYVIYHLHSDLSNGVTNVDSVTKFGQYVERASECGMKALGFSEHGSVFEWWHKKCAIEGAGMKYLHGVEAYLTESLEEKVRDNYHCVIIARNYDGFLELNSLVTKSFNRKDGHFYYTPRITFDELFRASDNLIITSACVGGVFGKGSLELQETFLRFMEKNKDRCFLEIGHHPDDKQKLYNRRMLSLHRETGVPLIAGTDTHVLDATHEKGRTILQQAKNIRFDGEEGWDLKFKTYDELVESYERQQTLETADYITAIKNTNVLADMVEEFKIDCGTKYPHIYDHPEETFEKKIREAIDSHPYASKNHTREELEKTVAEELEVYKATKSIDFMLLQTYLREWEKDHGIQCGYGRGSVSGSMIAYLLGITQMDSLRFGLNFFRFLNPSRVTNADIDSDYGGKDRDVVKEFLLRDHMNVPTIRSAEIITFNTIALKGAVRDVCRALYKDSELVNYMKLSDEISRELDDHEAEIRAKYPQIFDYVDIINGTIVSVGTHPSGVLLSDLPIDERIGLCSISSSDYPVSMLNMKELDDQFFVKLDILGLDNVAVINETCKMLGIERLTPDNTDLEDEAVWKSIRDDTTLIFQWESRSAQTYLKKFMSDATIKRARERIPNFSMLKWLSFGNGLIRPACASFRDSVANGEFYDNGFDELNEFLAPEAGRIAMQETIMQFLVKFCGYSAAESDTVRRGIAKKKGTEKLLPEIRKRFIKYTSEHYGLAKDRCAEVIEPFIKVILDASAYAFSWNHSDSYSALGYICGYLRYYHPLEFLTAALNVFGDNLDKTAEIAKYANKVGIKVTAPRWGISRGEYFFDPEKNIIAKGLASLKYMGAKAAVELYELSHSSREFKRFVDVLRGINTRTSLDLRQLDILIKLDFFEEFGNQRELLRIKEMFYDTFKRGDCKKISKEKVDGTPLEPIIQKYAVGITKSGGIAKCYTLLDVDSIIDETEDAIRALHLEDLSDLLKVRNFADIMGYQGYVTGKEEDRRKLYVTSLFPAKRKRDGKQFGWVITTKSLGSGKEARFTVFNKLYDGDPISKDDIIYCKGFELQNGYYTLTNYNHIY